MSSMLRCRRGGLTARRVGGGAVCGRLPLPSCCGFAAPLALLLLLCSDAPFCAGARRGFSGATRLLIVALPLLLLLMQVEPALLQRDPAVGGWGSSADQLEAYCCMATADDIHLYTSNASPVDAMSEHKTV